jgi:hypothetical protein
MARKLSSTTTDHDEIRRWAEERGGSPAEVAATRRGEDDTGIIRIDFPGYSGAGKLRPISWDDWFEKFDASNLALVYQDETAAGQRSNFNKLVARGTAKARKPARKAARKPLRKLKRTARAAAAGRGARRSTRTQRGAPSGRRSAARATAARTASRKKAGRKSPTARKSTGGAKTSSGGRKSTRGKRAGRR